MSMLISKPPFQFRLFWKWNGTLQKTYIGLNDSITMKEINGVIKDNTLIIDYIPVLCKLLLVVLTY